ncbi:choice-of-anchor J domain-containing protein [Pontibacter sp. MBLB2868]|uniref:choice-of-anchor J domain-containing protein n=1 Tax=Pontibacter sp. MBLB2868 TaxID=3451555 RepID=UPI003F75561A
MTKNLQKLSAFVLVFYAFCSSSAFGQSNPVAQNLPFSTDFSSMQNTTLLPNGIAAWYSNYQDTKAGAEASVPNADAPIMATSSKQTSSSSVYNYTLDGNNRLYIQLTSSRANQIAAAVNTTGKANVKVAYDVELVNNQPRSVGVTLQYRVGTTGAWTTVANTDYSSTSKSTEGAVESFSVNLPSEVLDKAVVQLRWVTYEITVSGVSGNRDGIALDNIVVNDGASTVAPISTSESALGFGSLAVNEASSVLSYTLTGSDLTSGVTLTTVSPFSISKSATGEFVQSINFSATEVAAGVPVYVKVNTATAGAFVGSVVHSSTGLADVSVTLAAEVYSPFVQNFNNCAGSAISGGWMQYSVTGAQTWACTTFGMEGNAVQMSGYEGMANANTDWLISPKLDINSFAFPLLSFNYRTKFTGDALDVRVSTDYSGSGDPAAATWTTIETLEADDADVWKTFENFNLEAYKSANTYIAFVYTSTTSSAARWTLDNFQLQNAASYINTNDFNLRFDETAVGGVSAPNQFTFEAGGFTQNVIVTAPTNFELSKDGTTYAQSLTYTPAEAATTNTVFVRFKPLTAVALSSGPVSFTSGSEPSVTRGSLSGSSILRAATLDVVTWNLEWFGSTSNGPSDEDLQYANVRLGLSALNADIIALQEVVDEVKAQQLAQQLGYNYISEKMSWQGSNDQIVAFMYNPAVVTVKKEKVILSKLYTDILANTTTLSGYPTGNSNLLWASGRLPYLVQFEANIDGVKQTYNLINIHAKANSGDDMVQYDRRKYDLQVLKDTLDAQYANMNLILLGDYNDDVDMSVVGTGNASTYEAFVTDEDYITLTYNLSTTGAATYESSSLQSFLDHQIISKPLAEEYIDNSINIESQLLNLIPNYRSTTSDHLPVSARYYIQSETTTGIADATKGQFSVYPNPFVNNVKLDLPERVSNMRSISLVIYGIEGRKLLEVTGSEREVQQHLNSNLTKLSKGLYILKVEAGSEIFQSRMIKQ